MGNGPLTKEQMRDYQGETKGKLTKKDIERYHKFWYDLFPNGEMTKQGFKKFSEIALPKAPEDADVDYLFRAMDANKDGTITFKEFLLFQSITAPTTKAMQPEELIEIAFEMYDEDGDGYVTLKEMKESLTNMYKAKGLDVTDENIIRIENLLKIADANNDGQLTREEIFKACKQDPSLLAMF
ncbi:calcium sensor [Acrasis kona]|uniref:Calcium sensor n=1 Tax=Acrasis kona TaxID=1008807 RepID=A0AAW2Z7Z1_9EUKA